MEGGQKQDQELVRLVATLSRSFRSKKDEAEQAFWAFGQMIKGPHIVERFLASVSENACAQCGAVGDSLSYCGSCQQVVYCGKRCQQRHWKASHRQFCGLGLLQTLVDALYSSRMAVFALASLAQVDPELVIQSGVLERALGLLHQPLDEPRARFALALCIPFDELNIVEQAESFLFQYPHSIEIARTVMKLIALSVLREDANYEKFEKTVQRVLLLHPFDISVSTHGSAALASWAVPISPKSVDILRGVLHRFPDHILIKNNVNIALKRCYNPINEMVLLQADELTCPFPMFM